MKVDAASQQVELAKEMGLVVSKQIEKKIGIQGISEKGCHGKGDKRGSKRNKRNMRKCQNWIFTPLPWC